MSPYLPFDNILHDGLGITVPAADYFQMAETGMYDISVSVEFIVSGVSVSSFYLRLKTEVNDTERNLRTAETNNSFLHLGTYYIMTYTFPLYLQQGDRVRFHNTVPWNLAIAGMGIAVTGGSNTYVTFRKAL